MSDRVLMDDQAGREVDLWAKEQLAREDAKRQENPNTPGAGMTMGAIDILMELRSFLRGEAE